MESAQTFAPGDLITARGRLWVVQSDSTAKWLRLRPINGATDETIVLMPELELNPLEKGGFPYPKASLGSTGVFSDGRLLYDALRFQVHSGTGPFRSFASLNFTPRSYQYVPLLMALKQKQVRLLIADDVGVGKTIEAGMIIREMIDRGDISTFAVLCPPHLVEQWVDELNQHFNLKAQPVTSITANALEKQLPIEQKLTDRWPYLVVSLDYIKSERHRDYFKSMAVDMYVVDEAHTCAPTANTKQQRFAFLQSIVQDEQGKNQKHLLMLTATPHSGDDDAFSNLLSLLDKRFISINSQNLKYTPLRQELANHLIQRQRADIEKWSKQSGDEEGLAFAKRWIRDQAYELDNNWLSFLAQAQKFFNQAFLSGEDSSFMQYMVISLYRCMASSPASAFKALENLLHNAQAQRLESAATVSAAAVDTDDFEPLALPDAVIAEGMQQLADVDDDDSIAEFNDAEPNILYHKEASLKKLLNQVKKLRGPEADPKLRSLIAAVQELFALGCSPVIFCRFVGTAQYVAEELNKALNAGVKPEDAVTISAVTGELTPAERQARVLELGKADKRILVATDCLSEGINLQQSFNAVVHYDLAWNPMRHEQREGRVDRFGQISKDVRCMTMYGQNNQVDAMVLEVIGKKARNIRRSLGVELNVPVNMLKVAEILRNAQLFEGSLLSTIEQGEVLAPVPKWVDASELSKASNTVFAHYAIHFEDVRPFWEEQQRTLGSLDELKHFAHEAGASFGLTFSPVAGTNGVERMYCSNAHEDLTKLLEAEYGQVSHVDINMQLLNRVNPLIAMLSGAVLKQAMAPKQSEQSDNSKLSRLGIAISSKVELTTQIFVLRARYQMRLAYNNQTRHHLMVEEALPVALQGVEDGEWLSPEDSERLLLTPRIGEGNVDPDEAVECFAEALQLFTQEAQQQYVHELLKQRAQQILADHKSVKEYTSDSSVVEVTPCEPADVIGCYILLPVD